MFGRLKQRFRCLKNRLRIRLDCSQDAIIACACLHNIAMRANLTFDENGVERESEDKIVPGFSAELTARGSANHQNLRKSIR